MIVSVVTHTHTHTHTQTDYCNPAAHAHQRLTKDALGFSPTREESCTHIIPQTENFPNSENTLPYTEFKCCQTCLLSMDTSHELTILPIIPILFSIQQFLTVYILASCKTRSFFHLFNTQSFQNTDYASLVKR